MNPGRPSSWAWAMTGLAPAARSTLALRFITTRLVMQCTNGDRALTAVMSCQISAALMISVIVG